MTVSGEPRPQVQTATSTRAWVLRQIPRGVPEQNLFRALVQAQLTSLDATSSDGQLRQALHDELASFCADFPDYTPVIGLGLWEWLDAGSPPNAFRRNRGDRSAPTT
jgi:hypothetical protein